MCGIVGFIDPDLGPQALEALLASLHHRGPDGDGSYHEGPLFMGMRRLSVIDLAGGWQPLRSRGGQVVAFQNGEIYNYRELRRELEALGHAFASASDTEVLAHGYAAWGMDGLLRRVDGMYAIALLDRDARELFLARDRFGEKPLFISSAANRFCYGSSLASLAAMPWIDASRVDDVALSRYLSLHFSYGRGTILRDVERVLPGEYVRVSLDDLAVERTRYYRPPLRRPRPVSDDELLGRLEHAVGSRLVADVPVGVFLSGGLDSSVVAALAAREHPHISTFSMGFDDAAVDESEHAAAVAAAIGSRHHSFRFAKDSFDTLLPQVAAALDEPIGDQALLPLFWLCREARRTATVVLSGEGADEIFGGYSYYAGFQTSADAWQARFGRLMSPADPVSAARHASFVDPERSVTQSGFPTLLSGAELAALIPQGRRDVGDRDIAAWLSQAREPLQRAQAADIATWLVDDLLVKFDRMAMAHSLEGRAPYLDPALVELGLNLPERDRMAGSDTKIALRRVAERLLPEELTRRAKQGFVLPMSRWLGDWIARRGGVEQYLKDSPLPFLDQASVTAIVGRALTEDRVRFLFAIVLLIEWWGAFQDTVARLRAEVGAGSLPESRTAAGPSRPDLGTGARRPAGADEVREAALAEAG